MALGMRNPSHWAPQQEFKKEVIKRTLAPFRTWDIKSNVTGRSLSIEQDGNVIYTTQSHFTVTKDPYVTLHDKDDDKTPIAGVKLGKGNYHLYLGDPSADSGVGRQECELTTGGNIRTFEHKFSPPTEHNDYAWRDTDQYELSITDTEIQSTGRDWKLISLTSDGEEDDLLAVYIHNPKVSMRNKSQIFWFGKVSHEVELWAMAAVLGLVERKRKSKDNFSFTSMVGAGAVSM